MPKPANSKRVAVTPTKPDGEAIRKTVAPILGEWFSVARHGDGSATVGIFGEVGMGEPARTLISALAGVKKITVHIDSLGGDSISGLAVHDAFKGRTVEAIITRHCYSAALTIALSAGHIRMERHAKILCHAPCSWDYGDAEKLAFTARHLRLITAQLRLLIMQRTELPAAVVEGWTNGADVYFTAEQARGYGLVDSIFDLPAAPCTRPAATEATAAQPPGDAFTEDEQFVFSVLSALPRLRVHNRQTFLREVISALVHNTDESI